MTEDLSSYIDCTTIKPANGEDSFVLSWYLTLLQVKMCTIYHRKTTHQTKNSCRMLGSGFNRQDRLECVHIPSISATNHTIDVIWTWKYVGARILNNSWANSAMELPELGSSFKEIYLVALSDKRI